MSKSKTIKNDCIECEANPIWIKKWNLCKKCYERSLRTGVIVANSDPFPGYKLDRFKKSLAKRYSQSIFKDFDYIKNVPLQTLARIGVKYGFSRERARQIFHELYGYNLGHTGPKKTKIIEKEKADSKCLMNDPRRKVADYVNYPCSVSKGVKYEKLFYTECEKRGHDIDIICDSAVDIKINGLYVDVKSSIKIFNPNRSIEYGYHHYNISSKQRKLCDFIACWHGSEAKFFIIPISAILSNVFYIRAVKSDHCTAKNLYWEYRDAWNLLTQNTHSRS